MNRFMKYERILLLLGYPWAMFVQNWGGWVTTLGVSFFLSAGGFLGKLPFLTVFENYENPPPLFIIWFIIQFIIQSRFMNPQSVL